MKVYILVCCIALTAARPEAGYSYNPPVQQLQPVVGGHQGPCCQQLALLKNSGLLHGHASGSGVSNIIVGRPAAGAYVAGPSASGFHPTHSAFGTVGTAGHGSSSYNGGHSLHSGVAYNGGHSNVGFHGGHSNVGLVGSYNGGHSSVGFNGGHSNLGFHGGHSNVGFSTALGANGGHVSNHGFGGSSLVGSGSSQNVGFTVPQGPSLGTSGSGAFSTNAAEVSQPVPGPAVVQKHIYVHVPPNEPEESVESLQRAVGPALARKHYKIIFIKAPSPPSYKTAQLVSQAGLTEEKTLVYVLVKKPDEPTVEEIQAAQHDVVQHNKPEVYFIKYKTKGAEGHAVSGGQYSASGSETVSAGATQGTAAPVYGPPQSETTNQYLPPSRK